MIVLLPITRLCTSKAGRLDLVAQRHEGTPHSARAAAGLHHDAPGLALGDEEGAELGAAQLAVVDLAGLGSTQCTWKTLFAMSTAYVVAFMAGPPSSVVDRASTLALDAVRDARPPPNRRAPASGMRREASIPSPALAASRVETCRMTAPRRSESLEAGPQKAAPGHEQPFESATRYPRHSPVRFDARPGRLAYQRTAGRPTPCPAVRKFRRPASLHNGGELPRRDATGRSGQEVHEVLRRRPASTQADQRTERRRVAALQSTSTGLQQTVANEATRPTRSAKCPTHAPATRPAARHRGWRR